MEKIPYKPGDVLVDKYGYQRMVIDLSNNKEVVFLDNNGSNLAITYTKEMLDISGYTLKTPKEDVCKNCNEHPCRKCLNKIIPGCIVCVCHYQAPTPWKPKSDESYFYLDNYGEIYEQRAYSQETLEFNLKSGNCFRTREEAEQKLNEIKGREI
jgi:hypothetical protein